MPIFKHFNLKGDLFATTFCFVAQAAIRLGSSVVLTRILRPEAYGVITILMSVVFVVELLADINVTLFIVRDKNADAPRYLNTAWTMRLVRSVVNASLLFACSSFIATSIYHLPTLAIPLRVFSLWFIISGLESMSFPLAVRRKRSRIIPYSELTAACVSTPFALIYSYYFKDYWGIVLGTLLNRLLMTLLSHQFYKELRPKFQFDRGAAKEILQFTKFTMPSSLLTLSLSQFDKIAFLRFFDLQQLGVYGLAGNIAGPIESLISKISQLVLYPRCAHNVRTDPSSVSWKYYTENIKLTVSILIVPAAIGGAARLVIATLYDTRYAQAAIVLQAFMLRAVFLSLASPAEDLLIALGESQVILVGNVFRVIGMLVGSLAGYYLFGFTGFVYGVAFSGLPPLVYYLRLQTSKGMLVAKYEFYKVAFVSCVAISAYFVSSLLLTIWPILKIRV